MNAAVQHMCRRVKPKAHRHATSTKSGNSDLESIAKPLFNNDKSIDLRVVL